VDLPHLKDETSYLRRSIWRRLVADRRCDSIATVLSKSQPGPVFAYRFDWDEESSVMGYDLATALGAAHGLESRSCSAEFEAGSGFRTIRKRPRAARCRKHDVVLGRIAHSGNPGKGRDGAEVQWLPWGTDGKTDLLAPRRRASGYRRT
jgi:para-nitrobenzyl esterase